MQTKKAEEEKTPGQGTFSLPSASGVVSLLNDAEKTSHTRSGNSSTQGTETLSQPMLMPDSHRSTGSSTISSNSPNDLSPLSNSVGPNATDSGGSMTSIQPSSGSSSRDDSIESTKQIQASDDCEKVHSDGGATENNAVHGDSIQTDRRNGLKRNHDCIDEENDEKHRESSPSHKILSTTNLARSPKPFGSASPEKPSNVPMSMHDATHKANADVGRHTTVYGSAPNEGEEHESQVVESDKAKDATGRKSSGQPQIIDGKKRYPCTHPGCGKTFSTSGHAARHNRIHTGSKPYRCTFPGCNASFSRQDNSLQHYRTHVLHPKSRSANGADPAEAALIESELRAYHPNTIPGVQIGRRALEDGTAIAVVQEYVDEKGRRGEAVQRMVGQPKSGRRHSIYDNGSSSHSHEWDMHAPHHLAVDDSRPSQYSAQAFPSKMVPYPPTVTPNHSYSTPLMYPGSNSNPHSYPNGDHQTAMDFHRYHAHPAGYASHVLHSGHPESYPIPPHDHTYPMDDRMYDRPPLVENMESRKHFPSQTPYPASHPVPVAYEAAQSNGRAGHNYPSRMAPHWQGHRRVRSAAFEPYQPAVSDERLGGLTLLSSAATSPKSMEKTPISPENFSKRGSISSTQGSSPPSGSRTRASTIDLRLPIPTQGSKVPCSSDRTTTARTHTEMGDAHPPPTRNAPATENITLPPIHYPNVD